MYTVKEVARLSGTSVRTLHHYHEIGLLMPAHVGENRYRYYGEEELLRLQQILFYREFDVPLADIIAFLDEPDFDRVAALKAHKARLAKKAQRYRQLIKTIDRTIANLKGTQTMEHADLYKGFSPEKQAEYEDWLISEYGGDMRERIGDSKKAMARLSAAEQASRMADLQAMETELAGKMAANIPPESAALDDLLSRHRGWVGQMWGRACSPEAYAGLADLYLAHPDFEARYETIATGFTAYLTQAMKAHADRQTG